MLASVRKLDLIILLSIFIILCYALSIIWSIPVISLILPIIGIVIISLDSTKEFSNKKIQLLFMIIILIKVLFMIYQAEYKNLPMGGNDWSGYERHANELLNSSGDFLKLLFLSDVNIFSRIIAVIYYFFGNYIQLVNCFVFILSLSMVKYIHKVSMLLLNDKKLSNIIALVSSIWPISFIFSITVLRETPIQWAFIISVYCFLKYIKFGRLKYLIGLVVFSLIATIFHSGMIVVLLTYILLLSIYNVRERKISISILKILLFSILILLIWVSPVSELIMQKFNSVENTEDLIDRASYAAGSTNYVSNTPSNLLEILIQTPYRFIMFALSPLPWQINGASTLIAWLIDALPRLFLMYGLLIWLKRYKVNNDQSKLIKISIILIVIFTYIMFAWGTANYGTAMRHRAKIFPLEIIIMFWSFSLTKIKKRVNKHA